jgi:hypothetical protein
MLPVAINSLSIKQFQNFIKNCSFHRKATLTKFLSHFCLTFLNKNVKLKGGVKCLKTGDLSILRKTQIN